MSWKLSSRLALKLLLEADRFIADLQTEMREAFRILDAGMPRNLGVKISRKRNKEAWISVTPFDPQPDPPFREATVADAELLRDWLRDQVAAANQGSDFGAAPLTRHALSSQSP